MQWRFKSTGLFFSLLLLLVFIASCQNKSEDPSAYAPTPAETPAGTSSTPAGSPSTPKRTAKANLPHLDPTSPKLNAEKLNADKIVQDAIDQLTVGKILFNVPEEMEVGKTERVEVRIAKTITKDFAINLKGTGKSKIENIKFATVTEVELKGNNDDIGINPISTGSQLIGEKEYSEWSWDVTPKKSGEQTLSLIVNARIKIPQLDIDSVKKYPVEVKKIKVKVNPIHSVEDFLKDKWTDLFPLIFGSASVAGIVGWVRAKRKKSKKSNTKANDNQKNVDNQEVTNEE